MQLDEVLTALQSDTRQDLKDVLDGLSTALTSKPSAPRRRRRRPSARGETAAKSFNDAYDDIPAAERSTAQVFEAFLGTEPSRDLARLIDGTAKTTGALDPQREPAQGPDHQLQPHDGRVRRPSRATCAPRSASWRRRCESANGALASLNEAFPPTRAFAREILPGRARDAGDDRRLLPVGRPDAASWSPRPSSGGLVQELSPATADLARLTDESLVLLPQTDLDLAAARAT